MKVLKDDIANSISDRPIDVAEFTRHLGEMLLRLPAVAMIVGHTWPSDTIRDYFRDGAGETPEGRLACQFFKDVWTLPSHEIISKWYHWPEAQEWAMENTTKLTRLVNQLSGITPKAMEGLNADGPRPSGE